MDKPFGDSCGKAAVADQYTIHYAPEPFFFHLQHDMISILMGGEVTLQTREHEAGMMQYMKQYDMKKPITI